MNQLENDFFEIAKSNIEFNLLRNKVFLVTGATGFIGSMFIKSLLYCNKKHKLNLKIIGWARNKEKVKRLYGGIDDKILTFIYHDILDPINEALVPMDFHYVLHTVSITNSKQMILNPVDTIKISCCGTANILQLATQKQAKVLYLSSMEVYGQVNFVNKKVEEADLGYIDLTNIRSGYCEAKRLCENLCIAYSSQYSTDVVIARLAQTFGAGILPEENRVFAQFAKSAIRKENIVLHTAGVSEGNYCYITDAIISFLLLYLKGERANIYNICNEECHTTILGMAELVANNFSDGQTKIIFNIPEQQNFYGYAENVKMQMSSQKLSLLGWTPRVNLIEGYRKMINYMKESNME